MIMPRRIYSGITSGVWIFSPSDRNQMRPNINIIVMSEKWEKLSSLTHFGRCASWLVIWAPLEHTINSIPLLSIHKQRPGDPKISCFLVNASRHAATSLIFFLFFFLHSSRPEWCLKISLRILCEWRKEETNRKVQPSSFVNISRTPETRQQQQTQLEVEENSMETKRTSQTQRRFSMRWCNWFLFIVKVAK